MIYGYRRGVRTLVLLAMIGVVIAVVIWGIQRIRALPAGAPRRQVTPGPEVLTGDLVERCTSAYGPDRGPGTLTLTPSQLIFAADSGRVVVLERLDIVGTTATADLPDRTISRAVLAVTTPADTWYFAVADPDSWLRRL